MSEVSRVQEPEPEKRTDMVSIRFEPAEASRIRAAAARAGVTVSALIRRAAVRAAQPMDCDRPGIQVRIVRAPAGTSVGGLIVRG